MTLGTWLSMQQVVRRTKRRCERAFRARAARGGCTRCTHLERGARLAKTLGMEPKAARQMLLAQHDRLRAHLGDCSVLARRVREGEPLHETLDAALDALRRELGEHNLLETSMLQPLLHATSAWSKLLLDRMMEEHVAEHAAFWDLLSGATYEVAERMDDLADELDAHMAAEERTFLSPQVLRDDRGPPSALRGAAERD